MTNFLFECFVNAEESAARAAASSPVAAPAAEGGAWRVQVTPSTDLGLWQQTMLSSNEENLMDEILEEVGLALEGSDRIVRDKIVCSAGGKSFRHAGLASSPHCPIDIDEEL